MSREIFLAVRVIKAEEGFRAKPYYCTEGFPTIGWGEVIGAKGEPLPDIVWSVEQAQEALDKKLVLAVKELSTNKILKPVWESLAEDSDRRAILISMWYQLGVGGVSKFSQMIKAILDKDWKKAAEEMMDSDVARRVAPKRWKRQSTAMLAGDVLSTYKL